MNIDRAMSQIADIERALQAKDARIKELEAAVEWACNELDSQALREATGVEYFRVSMWFKAELKRRAGKKSA